MSKELIPCPIDGTNLDWDIINDCFDNEQCLDHNGTYIGFVEGHPATIVHQSESHIIRILQVELQTVVTNRLQEALNQNDEYQPSEYRHIAKNTGGGYIHFYTVTNS